MAMEPSLSPSYLLLVLGGVLVLAHFFFLLGKVLNCAELGKQFQKLLQSKNLSRAVKLSQAAEHPVLVASRAVLMTLEKGIEYASVEGTDYRSGAVDRSPDAVLRILSNIFFGAFAKQTKSWAIWRGLGGFGAIALFAAAVFAVRLEDPPWVIVLAVVGIVCFLSSLKREFDQRRDARLMFQNLSEEFYKAATVSA